MYFLKTYLNLAYSYCCKVILTTVAIIVLLSLPNFCFATFYTINSKGLLIENVNEDTIAANNINKFPVLPFQIDLYDTVYFNIPSGNLNGTIIDIPVSISGNDTIYALDFSFKYNTVDLTIDSVINYTSGLQYLYHFNTTDSVFRFTSNRLTPIPNDSTLLHIRFTSLVGQLCAPDIDSAITYLNGEVCSSSITGCLVTALPYLEEEKIAALVYPNPATHDFSLTGNIIELIEEIIIYDRSGRVVKKISELQTNRFNIELLKPGLYLIELNNSTSGFIRKEKLIKL